MQHACLTLAVLSKDLSMLDADQKPYTCTYFPLNFLLMKNREEMAEKELFVSSYTRYQLLLPNIS